MKAHLTHNAYGKSRVRLTKVVRDHGPAHELFEITADVQLEGDFAAAYTHGDNRNVIATDTIKNTVYVVAKENRFDSPEQLGLLLARHFLRTYAHVTRATAELTQSSWRRIVVDGKPHDHAFTSAGPQLRYARATFARGDADASILGGVRDLLVLKTTASEWRDFHADRYRTLKDARDRIMATKVDAEWAYNTASTDFPKACAAIDDAILKTFAAQHSLGVQQTLFQMGEAALAACDMIDSIHFALPNQHRIPFNLEPFGLKFENDIFVATEEPFGLIEGTVSRSK
jgi:urate oxidase